MTVPPQPNSTWLAVYPTGEPRPTVSQLSVTGGVSEANTVVAKLGTGGQVDIYNRFGSVDVVIDIQGYFTDSTVTTAGGTFVALSPRRIYDTNNAGEVPLQAGETRDVQVTGAGGVPASGVSGVAVNLTVDSPSSKMSLLAHPTGDTDGSATTLHVEAGQIGSAFAQVKIGTGGKISVKVNAGSGPARLMVDVEGYYLDAAQNGRDFYVPISPRRIYTSSTDLDAGETRSIQVAGAKDAGGAVVVPSTGVNAVVLSVTSAAPAAKGIMVGWPTGQTQPNATLLSYNEPDNNVTGTAILPLGTGGKINIYSSAASGLVIDVQGYYQTMVDLKTPDVIYATGPKLTWNPYIDPSPADFNDIVEYQVHRSTSPTFTASAATLVAPVSKTVTTYTDTTATPTAADDANPYGRIYYYRVAVKTKDAGLSVSKPEPVKLPKAGRIIRVLHGASVAADTYIENGTSTPTGAASPVLVVGSPEETVDEHRALVDFDTSQIPTGSTVTDADFSMWGNRPGLDGETGIGGNDVFSVHALTRDFDPATATWTKANATTNWATPGGDYNPTAAANKTGLLVNTPDWHTWKVTSAVSNWITTPTSNHGLLVKPTPEPEHLPAHFAGTATISDPNHRPALTVTYLEKTTASTYYAPDTPARMIPGDIYTVPVTVSNATTTSWPVADWVVSYRWELPDGSPVPGAGSSSQTALPKTVVSGDTVTVNAEVKTPIQSDEGNKRLAYVLRWELFNKTTSQWLSQTSPSIGSLNQNITVEDPTSSPLGLERFYSYSGQATGAGSAMLVNNAAGNAVWSYDAFSNPSRGLNTFLRLAYNSLDTSDTMAGFGWSLQPAAPTRLGTPLDFHPNPNPTKVTMTDGDGTSHVFRWDAPTGKWLHPAGVHMLLQELADCGPPVPEEDRAWVMTRPDRTKFYFDCEGYVSAVVDNNGNELVFSYEQRNSNNKPTKFLKYITDPNNLDTLTLDYYEKGQPYSYIDGTGAVINGANLTNPHIIDKVEQVSDISGRNLAFTYTDKGLLGRLVDGAGDANAKTFKFDYDADEGNKNVKLVTVTDPRTNNTRIAYYDPPADPKFHWWAQTITDRLTNATGFVYSDPDGSGGSQIQTVVTDAENHATDFVLDGFGRPTQITNAKQEVTKLGWDDDNNLIRLEEPNAAVTTWVYDPNTGYPKEIKDAEANLNSTAGTKYDYTPILGPDVHVADLAAKTSPEGRKWAFTSSPTGDLLTVTDPAGTATTGDPNDFKTSYSYDSFGQLLTATDANGHTTSFSDYDVTGFPQTIDDADPDNANTTVVYDARGQVTKVTDANQKDTLQEYDVFGRPGKRTEPFIPGQPIITPAPEYDDNDNVTKAFTPNPDNAVYTGAYSATDKLIEATEPVDQTGDPARKTSYTYDKVGNLKTVTEPKGTLTTTDPDDFKTSYSYDVVNQLEEVTDADSGVTSYSYDNVGNLIKVVDPRKSATPDANDFTTKYTYNRNHWRASTTDAAGKVFKVGYDKDGLVSSFRDWATPPVDGPQTLYTLDARGKVSQVRVPHTSDGVSAIYRATKYEYDQVGNRTKVISPRGVATGDLTDFLTETRYDEMNRVEEVRSPFDPADANPAYRTANITTYSYDDVGRLATVSAPPSQGQAVGSNDTSYTYYDNTWTKTATDPWDIQTKYEYNTLGQQTTRELTGGGGDTSAPDRVQTWGYYPSGKLAARADEGIKVGAQRVLVDNSDTQNTVAAPAGSWATGTTATGKHGPDYRTRTAGGTDTFTWKLRIPQDGSYQVYVKYPAVPGAGSASYKITHASGTATPSAINQNNNTGTWVAVGAPLTFDEQATNQKIVLTQNAAGGGTVTADAVKLVRTATETDNEKVDFGYLYDPNGNLKTIDDKRSGAPVDSYAVTYSELNQVTKVEEMVGGAAAHTTRYGYGPNGNLISRELDGTTATFEYDVRDLLSKVTDPKVTRYTYTDRGQRLQETKPNGNTVDYTYFLDGRLDTQTEKKPSGTIVASHDQAWDPNGNKIQDIAVKQNADNPGASLNTTTSWTYDPLDRIKSLTKTGTGAGSESYTHDANNNVVTQTITASGTTTETDYTYDRNRLQTTAISINGGTAATADYNYDPYGRLDTVTNRVGDALIESYRYDGFDHIARHTKTGAGTTTYTYDALDRTTTKTTDAGGAGEKTTDFEYLGLTEQLVKELNQAGQATKTFNYDAYGRRLYQTKKDTGGGADEDGYYSYDPHSSIDTITGSTGDTKATYGYTAYGNNDEAQFTGIDKPDAQDPTKEPYNPYRYTAKRFDPNAGSYDLGFRDYSPGINRFLTRDNYSGALADMNLVTNPFTGNRYGMAAGNPISGIDYDGHEVSDDYLYMYPDPEGAARTIKDQTGTATADPRDGAVIAGVTTPIGRVGPATSPRITTGRSGTGPTAGRAGPGVIGVAAPILIEDVLDSWELGDGRRNIDDDANRDDCLSEQSASAGYIQYFNPDGGGRASGALACLPPWARKVDGRQPQTPVGWKPGMDRSHLIARQFGGTSDRLNVVPLWPNVNQEAMVEYEDEVRERLNSGERVYYSTVPIYSRPAGMGYYPTDPPAGLQIYIASSGRDDIVNEFMPNMP
ncbi:DNRLRE domain-containing protein [Actinopolymorpha sp. B9G3]|uniref:golvesin C-terminal-like domain-containing protein n=1 Tax=Actinopolymorpha sp. B9G3 TaxID=3158970 RepID=UPI0032D8FE48